MKETLYAIPVNEAFSENSECPLCALSARYEEGALESLLASAYMEPDCRIHTNEAGFCKRHSMLMFGRKNRLGMALMLDTHMQAVIQDLETILKTPNSAPRLPFPRGKVEGGAPARIHARIARCALCEQISEMEAHYLSTILHLYRQDAAFREKLKSCKGFCLPHFADLLSAAERLPMRDRESFVRALYELELQNLRRVEGDLSWFTQKFDYRNEDKPWGNSKDAVERAANKLRGHCCGEGFSGKAE